MSFTVGSRAGGAQDNQVHEEGQEHDACIPALDYSDLLSTSLLCPCIPHTPWGQTVMLLSYCALSCNHRGYDLYTTTIVPSHRTSRYCLVFHHGLSDHTARHIARESG